MWFIIKIQHIMSIEEIHFWANKFQDHFHIIGIFIVQNAEKLEKQEGVDVDDLLRQTLKFERHWQGIRDAFDMGALQEQPALIQRSYNFKHKLEFLVRQHYFIICKRSLSIL
jgi:hypothetical protein